MFTAFDPSVVPPPEHVPVAEQLPPSQKVTVPHVGSPPPPPPCFATVAVNVTASPTFEGLLFEVTVVFVCGSSVNVVCACEVLPVAVR